MNMPKTSRGRQQKKETYVSDREAQYDERAKKVAGSKIVIASILSKTVDAFRGMKPREIVPYIEGEPYIGSVPVEPGQTNASYTENGKRIVGFNTENQDTGMFQHGKQTTEGC